MNNPFLAKTENQETITEHTEKLYKNYKLLKKTYPTIKNIDWDILEMACLYHDLGKMNTKFQNKIITSINNKNNKNIFKKLPDYFSNIVDEIPHGYLSPAFLPKYELKKKYNNDELRVLYQSIYFHHSREKLANHDILKLIIQEDLTSYIEHFNYKRVRIKKLYSSFVRYTKRRIPDINNDTQKTIHQYIMTKGLLNKIDYAASAGVDVELENKNLFEKTNDYLIQNGYKPNRLQEYMIQHQDENNIIIASTGIGKTEAALFWIGNNKGFFTLPLKVSINAIYDRVIKKIRFEKHTTGLLHSDTSSEYLKRNNNVHDIEYFHKTKQISLPLTICTLDQLVDFIFKYEGYELKLATLSYSKLVIDEIQMYSPELVAFLIVALKYITEMGGKFSIVTATLPPIFIDFIKDYEIQFNQPNAFYKEVDGKVQLRHKLKVLEEDININFIKQNYKNKKVLVIVNTVKKAQQLYEELKEELGKDKSNINLLHSRFIKRDRLVKEDMIINMGKLKKNQKGIWITTQVVEASLDIDFDVLYTELSDLSGLFQRMGRVFRNRVLENNCTNVFVYIGKEKYPSGIGYGKSSIIDKDIFELSKCFLLQYIGQKLEEKEIDEKNKMKLVEMVYSKENLMGTKYFQTIKDTIKNVIDIKDYDYDKKNINLRNIDTMTVIPESVYKKNELTIKENLKIIEQKSNYNERVLAKNTIKQYILNIPKFQYDEAKEKGYIKGEYIRLDKYDIIPVISYPYCFELGLKKPKKLDEFDENTQFM